MYHKTGIATVKEGNTYNPCLKLSYVNKVQKIKPNKDYARSPRIRRASWMSLGMIVTRLA